jgi:hypothetical protein
MRKLRHGAEQLAALHVGVDLWQATQDHSSDSSRDSSDASGTTAGVQGVKFVYTVLQRP